MIQPQMPLFDTFIVFFTLLTHYEVTKLINTHYLYLNENHMYLLTLI